MSTQHFHDYLEEWLQNVFKHADLHDHEKVLVQTMIQLLPSQEQIKKRQEELFTTALGAVAPVNRGDAPIVSPEGDFIITNKKKKLSGADLERFWEFWNAFDYKKGRAEAAQAWMDIKDTKDKAFMDHILYAARKCASERKPTITPKMPQGWLSGRRWEDYEPSQALPEQWNAEKWRKSLTQYMKRNRVWPEYMPGPNPWDHKNTEIPGVVYELYAQEWGWK